MMFIGYNNSHCYFTRKGYLMILSTVLCHLLFITCSVILVYNVYIVCIVYLLLNDKSTEIKL
jgi:hypothetical protein